MLWPKRLAELSRHLWLLAGSAVLVAVLLVEHLSTLAGLAALIAVLLIGDWFRSWWTFNLLRNRLEAKRRLRREGRS
jgi:hypothetical protein